MQLAGLAVQLLRHLGQPAGRRAKTRDGLVHGLENGIQAGANQGKIPFILALRLGKQISLCHLGQYLLNVRDVAVDASHRVAQGVGQHLQLIPRANLNHFSMQVAV